jgi:hypothetical protein
MAARQYQISFKKIGLFSIIFLILSLSVFAAPKSNPWTRWNKNNSSNPEMVDHYRLDLFLSEYLEEDKSGALLVNYTDVTPQNKRELDGYLQNLEDILVTNLNRNEQKAFWINLYNAKTIQLILDNFPVKSIRDIDISPGLFSDGPWDAKIIAIEGEMISLNDIEHRILRPLWGDNRVHYALNCASIGCPDLTIRAYYPDTLDETLDNNAVKYINHPRGVSFESGKLVISGIYKWFAVDFGGSEEKVIEHLIQFSTREQADKLRSYRGSIKYAYDWDLNGTD